MDNIVKPWYDIGSRGSLSLDFGIGVIIPVLKSFGISPFPKQYVINLCSNSTNIVLENLGGYVIQTSCFTYFRLWYHVLYFLSTDGFVKWCIEFIQSLLSAGKKRLASQFNFTYRYIDDVLSINNPDFENYLGQIYPPELEIKDTTESNTSASYLDLLLSIGRDGQLHTSLYDKHDDFNFHITNFPFLSSNIPSSPAYGVFISQLIRYARACSSYECFILRAMRPFQ